jgi:hypothetical protein
MVKVGVKSQQCHIFKNGGSTTLAALRRAFRGVLRSLVQLSLDG